MGGEAFSIEKRPTTFFGFGHQRSERNAPKTSETDAPESQEAAGEQEQPVQQRTTSKGACRPSICTASRPARRVGLLGLGAINVEVARALLRPPGTAGAPPSE